MPKKKKVTKPKAKRKQNIIKIAFNDIDYKNVGAIKKFLSPRFKILPKKVTGLSTRKQNKLRLEIKKARIMGLLPFTDRHALG